MVSVLDITLEGRELSSRGGAFPKSTRMLNFVWIVSSPSMREKKIGAWKIVFLQSLRFLQAIEENNVSGPQAYPYIDLGGLEAVQACAKHNFSELETLIFCKTQFHPVRQYKGSRQENEIQMGIANLTYKQ